MSQVRLRTAFVLGVILESVLCGIFIPFLLAACYAQWQRRVKGHCVNKIMVFTTAFYALAVVLHWSFSCIHTLRGIFFLPPKEDMETFFEDFSNPLFVCKATLLQIEVLVGGWIMIYRLYHIYGRNPAICIVPLVGSLGLLATVFGSTIEITRIRDPAASTPWTAVGFGVMTFNSLCISSLIAIRLWRTQHTLLESGIRVSQSLAARVMRAFIESAALWTTFVAINFTLFLARTNLRFISLDLTGPVIGISFCLITVKLGHTAERRPAPLPLLKTVEFAVPTIATMASTCTTTDEEESPQGLRNHIKLSTIGK